MVNFSIISEQGRVEIKESDNLKWKKKEPVLPYGDIDRLQRKLASIHGIENIPRFLSPTVDELHSPYLLKNIKAARDKIVEHINKKSKIIIHIDIDSDGANSGMLMYQYIRNFTDNIGYIHSQRSEGHSIDISEHLVPDDTDLLIIIDSSSNSVECCERLSKRGIEIVVLDHHEVDCINPHVVLINPQQSGCQYPNKSISAAVVAWKVSQVLDEHYKTNYAEQYYDLVAIGLVGDMMSLLEYENRYIVTKGLNNIRNIGIKALLKELKLNTDKLSSTDISYFIAPCVNAACRMDRIEVILELLIEKDEGKAQEKAKEVVKMNEERKKIQSRFAEKLKPFVDDNKCSIIIDNEVGKGFKGLIAGEFCNEFQKPIMILSQDDDGSYAGSYRAYNDFDLKSMLNEIPEVIFAAGHPPAGGVRFKIEHLETIRQYLNEHLDNNVEEQEIEYVMEFDAQDLDEFTTRTVQDFYRLSGKNFETGKFLIKNVCPLKKVIMGKDKNTIKIPIYPASQTWFYDKKDYDQLPSTVALMKFRTNEEYFSEELIGKEIECVGTLNWNEFTNFKKITTKTAQVFIEDYRVVE